MKKLWFVVILVLTSMITFSQNENCLKFSNDIIKNTKGKIINQQSSINDTYIIKVDVPNFDINNIKMAVDSTKVKTSIDWNFNSYDKFHEKQILIGNSKMIISFYPNDKVLYFEFPKK